jgi:MbtH protein
MENLLDDMNGTFLVLANDEGQHSLWPEPIAVPVGWSVVHPADTRQNCLDYIGRNWTDMRPLSLQRAVIN